jgi:hypothetical protein
VVDDESGTAREKLYGVRKCRRDHRSSGGDGVNKDA